MTRGHESIPLLPERRPTYAPARSRIDGEPEEKYAGFFGRKIAGEWAEAENMHRLRDHADRRSNPTGGKDAIPAVVGGQTLTAVVAAGTDTRVPHRLGRVPQAITHVESTGASGDTLTGRPEGGYGATGGNDGRWTATEVYVRSNVAAPGRTFSFTVS